MDTGEIVSHTVYSIRATLRGTADEGESYDSARLL